jgi:hypothetical protein
MQIYSLALSHSGREDKTSRVLRTVHSTVSSKLYIPLDTLDTLDTLDKPVNPPVLKYAYPWTHLGQRDFTLGQSS